MSSGRVPLMLGAPLACRSMPPGPQRLPSASVQATHTPERLESNLTREILVNQKSGNSDYLDKKTSLYRDFGEIRKNRCWKLLRPRESVGTTLGTLLTCCGTLRRLRRPREPFPMPLELLDVFGVTSGEPPWIGSQYDKNPWIFMDFRKS